MLQYTWMIAVCAKIQ